MLTAEIIHLPVWAEYVLTLSGFLSGVLFLWISKGRNDNWGRFLLCTGVVDVAVALAYMYSHHL